ncbi:DUF4160 domain-containing protein [Castellaniella defragrans]|jgi:hypothetical protein|uniref:DUF4160 domain-containing protein n=1 Tax=Castellaniella defragrans TaxID=75697 RepID=UPI002AFE4451|nr:DUF4160 domain-containing protein [Castellaniella defragrans]
MTTYPPHDDWRIRINGNEHGVPHVHVEFRDGSRASVSIETRRVLAGGVTPAKRLIPALEDIQENATKYMTEYRRLNP